MEKETVTRAIIVQKLNDKYGYPKSEMSSLVDSLFDEMSHSMKQDGEVKIATFGSFKVRSKKARIGRNPKTKVEAEISARNVVSFYASKILKKRLKDNS